jgi:hypothetical protein
MARILSRSETYVSPWIRLVRKDVEFSPDRKPETYHAISQADYISIFAVTRSGLIPIVKQYIDRPLRRTLMSFPPVWRRLVNHRKSHAGVN